MSIEIKSVLPALPKTARGVPLVINAGPKGKSILYTNGISVIIRSIESPEDVCKSEIYAEHACAVNAAKCSPSECYVASGDVSGKVRIWALDNEDRTLKNEFHVLGGAVKDLSWSGDNQRIVAVGLGKEKFGHVFTYDSGNSVGEITGHTKDINSCDFKQNRPYRIASAGEDFAVVFYEGPPFKFSKTLRDHTRFVNAVRYAPDGSVFVSGGADGKAYVFDGKTGERTGELGEPAHSGGIYAVSFSPDSKQVLTASGDKTCKIFDVESGRMLNEFKLGEMQVSCLWMKDNLISVGLSGFINFLDPENPHQPLKVIKGHNKPITSLTIAEDSEHFYTAGLDGFICEWDVNSLGNEMFAGTPHTNQIQAMKLVDRQIISVSMDDTYMVSDVDNKTYGDRVKLPSQPLSVDAITGNLAMVACSEHIVMIREGQMVCTQESGKMACVALHPHGEEVALGGPESKVLIYSIAGNSLTETRQLEQTDIVAVAYSPDGALFAAADASKAIAVYELPAFDVKAKSSLRRHTARINSLAWSPDSKYLASTGLDNNIYVYDMQNTKNVMSMWQAHPKGNINSVRWLTNTNLVTVSNDGNTKIWTITEQQTKKS